MNDTQIEPCKICGGTESNLIDGFYYCAECGTQDTNVRETIIEHTMVGEGVTALGQKKRITLGPEKKIEMSGDWYKWHTMNFLLQGLANEVIECGAAPSFKTKLLWIWTRYMKKFQKNADFGREDNENENVQANSEYMDNLREEEQDSGSDDYGDERPTWRTKYSNFFIYHRDIKRMSMCLVMSMLHAALNLDRSPIQLSHLIRFIKDGRISIIGWMRHVPEELRPRRLRFCLTFHRAWFRHSIETLRFLTLQLFKELDLGTPLVPDIRRMVDDYMKELCLPTDLTPLVHSLMRYRTFDFLDVHLHKAKHMPLYELYVIAHILFALKIIFGLDGVYETRVSDAVEKINQMEDKTRSYNSEPKKRLFSFNEWFKFILFRRSQLWAHTLLLGSPNYNDMDDYVACEHQFDPPDYVKSKQLRVEIAWDILRKLPRERRAIPRAAFPASVTPYTCYTRVVVDHIQDPDTKKLLSEDFAQYSMSYFFKDLFLVDPDSENPENLLTGVNPENVIQRYRYFVLPHKIQPKFDYKMVYVKDCENHNWMTTQKPTLDHIATDPQVDSGDENSIEKENINDDLRSVTTVDINDLSTANGEADRIELLTDVKDNNNISKDCEMIDVDSTCDAEAIQNDVKYETASDIQSVTTVDIHEFSSINETKVELNTGEDKLTDVNDKTGIIVEDSRFSTQMEVDGEQFSKKEDLDIREEDEGVSIFDDDFETKKETDYVPHDEENFFCSEDPAIDETPVPHTNTNDDDQSSDDSFNITPDTLDRNTAIKELVIHACKKLKAAIPGRYNFKFTRKDTGRIRKKPNTLKNTDVKDTDMAEWIKQKIEIYNSKLEQDIFFQMSNMVQSAVADFNQTKTETPMETDEPVDNNNEDNGPEANEQADEVDIISDSRMEDAPPDDQHRLFDEESDGETQAEDLLPKKNPDFDEETHDVSQLYLKPAEDTDLPELLLTKGLLDVIDETILLDDLDGAPEEPHADSDPEDNVPLKVIKEIQLIEKTMITHGARYSLKHDPCNYGKFFPKPAVLPPHYNYWVKAYKSNGGTKAIFNHADRELKEMKNDTFASVLRVFSDVVGYPPYYVLKSLQHVETFLVDRYVHRRRLFDHHYIRGKKGINKQTSVYL